MIGNDLVDLRRAQQESNWRRPRYLDKLFTPNEQWQIAQAADPDTRVWLLWSCKEAAYKAWASQTQQRRYRPRQIAVGECAIREKVAGTAAAYTAKSTVKIAARTYVVRMLIDDDFIHAWTITSSPSLLLRETCRLDPQDASGQIRKAVKQRLANHFAWSVEDISIQKNEHGRPLLYYQKRPCGLMLSLAHHGAYGAYVVAATE